MSAADVALLTDRRYERPAESNWYIRQILEEDRLLGEALSQKGLTSERLDWSRDDVNWSKFRCAIIRSTWDYFDRFAEYQAWLDRIETATLLLNPAAVVRWNMDKHYLADLAARGVSVVATEFLEPGTSVDLAGFLRDRGWEDAVIKPAVSGAARHTYRVSPATAGVRQQTLDTLLETEAMLVQPFQQDIVARGEVTLMVIGGEFTHAVRKVCKAGDFRVQDDHGGTVHEYEPNADEIGFALRAMAVVCPEPVYGRVDMVLGTDGEPAVMELELVEPELWLRNHPPAAVKLAEAVARRLDERNGGAGSTPHGRSNEQ